MTLGLRELRPNGDQRVEAVHLRHLQVHQRDVRPVSPELLDRVAAVGGLCHQRHVRLDADEPGDPVANERMIVDRENPNRRAAAGHDTSPLPHDADLVSLDTAAGSTTGSMVAFQRGVYHRVTGLLRRPRRGAAQWAIGLHAARASRSAIRLEVIQKPPCAPPVTSPRAARSPQAFAFLASFRDHQEGRRAVA